VSVREALERLAPDHDYAAVVGDPDLEAPRVVVGAPGTDDAAVHADAVASLDVEAAVAAIDEAEPYETLQSLVATVKRSAAADRAGAIATFTGRVRATDGPDDDRTRYLEFEKYDGVAGGIMRGIEADLEARAGVYDVRLHHRTGRVDAGEDIVFVVVLAGHRREAFRTVEDGIDRLKDEVPLFKKEVTEAETFWVHERE
jgi:molybdopterin synthase catalytic subunit